MTVNLFSSQFACELNCWYVNWVTIPFKIEYSPFLGSFWSFWKKFSDLEERKSLRILRVIFIFRLTFLSQFQFHFLFYFHYKDNFYIEKHYSVIKMYRHKFNQGFHGIFVLVHFVILVVENNSDEKYVSSSCWK